MLFHLHDEVSYFESDTSHLDSARAKDIHPKKVPPQESLKKNDMRFECIQFNVSVRCFNLDMEFPQILIFRIVHRCKIEMMHDLSYLFPYEIAALCFRMAGWYPHPPSNQVSYGD